MIAILLFSWALAAKPIQYPVVSAVQGKVFDQKTADKPQLLKRKDVLKEKALLITSASSEIRIELDPYASLTVFPNSEIELPIITWGEGEVLEMNLHKGKVRYECEKSCVRSINTELSKTQFTNGDYFIEMRPESPYVELTVVHGVQEFSGLENEASVKLQGGQKAVFQGLKENGEIAYDVLLKGKKVARGQLQPIVNLSEADRKNLEGLGRGLLQIKAQSEVKPPTRTAAQICDKPFGELNQCSWSCEGPLKRLKKCDLSKKGIQCIRRRCNANGQWEDPTPLNQLTNKCEIKPIVGACDY